MVNLLLANYIASWYRWRLVTERDGFHLFGGVRQNVVEPVLLLEEMERKDHLLDEETERTGVYGCERLLVDPKLRSSVVGVFIVFVELKMVREFLISKSR